MKTPEETLKYIDKEIDKRIERPAMFGSDESVEMDFLSLMNLRYWITGADGGEWRFVLDRFINHNMEYFPGCCIALSSKLKSHNLERYFPAMLSEFRQQLAEGRDFTKFRKYMDLHKNGALPPPFEEHADNWKSLKTYREAMDKEPLPSMWEYLGFSDQEREDFINHYRLPRRENDELYYDD